VSKLLKNSQQTHNVPARYDPLCPQYQQIAESTPPETSSSIPPPEPDKPPTLPDSSMELPEGSLQRRPSHWWLAHHVTMQLQARKLNQVHLIWTCWTTRSCQGFTPLVAGFVEGLVQPGDRGDTCVGGQCLWTDDLDKSCDHFRIHGYEALSPKPQPDIPLDPDA